MSKSPNATINQAVDIENGVCEFLPEQSPLETRNHTHSSFFKIYTCCFGYIIFGMNGSSIGGIVNCLESDYHVDHSYVSLTFCFSFIGYLISAFSSDIFHRKFGRSGTSLLGVFSGLICYLIASSRPPFMVFVISYVFSGFGNGLLDASWNAWAGNLKNKNKVLGLLHGFSGIGATLAPAVETFLISSGYKWNSFYYILTVLSLISLVNTFIAFKDETAMNYLNTVNTNKIEPISSPSYGSCGNELTENNTEILLKKEKRLFHVVATSKLVWLFASTLCCYVGSEVTIGGWTTTFLTQVRHGQPDRIGFVVAVFWGGIALGRFCLGAVSGKFQKEEHVAVLYMCLSIAFFVGFSLVPLISLSALFIALVGFCMGPLYPSMIIVFLQKVPEKQHILGLGLITSFGGVGSALAPFVNGILFGILGPWVLCPFTSFLMFGMLLFWLFIIRLY